MDHEILSRGKRVDSQDWIEGYYVHLYNGKGRESHRIYTGYAETDCGEFYPVWYEVDPDTVGQYTGLTDKNGVKIFEGDIVRANIRNGKSADVVIYESAMFKVFGVSLVTWTHPDQGLEVIGNIHDNPELMEERHE